MNTPSPFKPTLWRERLTRSGYFIGAVLAHLIIFVLVATYIVFPPVSTPPDNTPKNFTSQTQKQVDQTPATTSLQINFDVVPAPPASNGAPVIAGGTSSFPVGAFKIDVVSNGLSTSINATDRRTKVNPHPLMDDRIRQIQDFVETGAHRTFDDIAHSGCDPRNIKATFPVYLASYANGDWDCNVHMTDGRIDSGGLPNLVAKINEWSHGHINGEMVPTPLNIASQELIDKKPPFIFFTGHKDFVLTDAEVQNLRDYLQIGGAVWGDNALAGRGSRFDVAFRREMKRVVGDDFTPVTEGDKMLTKWFPQEVQPSGMNYYAEPIEHIDIDGRLAIIYTPNDYSDLFFMHILTGDTQVGADRPDLQTRDPLFTSGTFWNNRHIFFRNFELPSCLHAQRLGMNIVAFMLVRFDQDLILSAP